MITLSDRATQLQPSPTLAVTALFKQMLREGRDVIGFGAGEPDFDTPDGIKEAAISALRAGKTKYEPAAGSVDARNAVAKNYSQRYGCEIKPENILISCGGKHSLYLIFQAMFNPGDELLLPAPYWVSYPEQVKLAGGTTRVIRGRVENEFKITPDQLREAIGPKSRALLLNSPGNPTGTTYSDYLDSGASYTVTVVAAGEGNCPVDVNRCIKSVGAYKETKRAIQIVR